MKISGGEGMKSATKNQKGGEGLQETEHYRRYPEEEFIDEQEADDGKPGRAGAELAEHFRAVTGRAGRAIGRKD
jgi:hypothetical protein